VSLHLIEDVMGWVAVLLVSIVMMFVDVPILDPLLSLAITVWVLRNVYRNLRDTFKVLLQEVPQNIDVDSMMSEINKMENVRGLHDFHLWSLDGENNIMTLHVVTPNLLPTNNLLQLKQDIRQLASDYGINHVTLEFEDEKEAEMCQFLEDC
jgi:cobalt-zinc-cadmium efflux system protein